MTEGKHCKTCGVVLIAQEVIEKKKHENAYICSYCGKINETYYSKGLEFSLSDDKTSYSVYLKDSLVDKEVIIPSIYNDLPVTHIKDNAFAKCSLVTSITIPSSVNTIGENAFYQCNNLSSIIIPYSVKNIGNGAFALCSSLKKVYYLGIIEEWCGINFANSSATPLVQYADFYVLNDNNDWNMVKNISLKNGVSKISDYAFYKCKSLESIVIPDSVTSIGKNAFSWCDSLSTVLLGNGVTLIEENAFERCSLLSNITLSNKTKIINDYAFQYCTSLTDIALPESSVHKALMRSVLVHIVNKQPAISEIYRILKPGGKFCAFEPIIRSNTRYWEILDPMYIERYEDFKRAENEMMENPMDSLCNFDE